MKKAVSILLCLAVLLSMSAFAATNATSAGLSNFKAVNEYSVGTLSDVAESSWYYDNVKTSYELALMMGNSETTFNPTGKITVVEAIALASRIHSIYTNGEASFVQGSPWYEVYTTYAVENNLIEAVLENGDIRLGGQSVRNTASITRAQFAMLFSAVLPAEEYNAINSIENGAIPDIAERAHFSDAVYLLYNAGILTGSDAEGSFKPHDTIQRCEVAAIATRIVDKNLRKTFSLSVKEILKSYTSCYENSFVPDCGAFFNVDCVYSDEVDKITRYLYLESDILASSHDESPFEAYLNDLEKAGFYIEGRAGSQDDPILVYTDNVHYVFVAATNYNDQPVLLVGVALCSDISGE